MSVFCPCSVVQGFTQGVASAHRTLQNRADVDTCDILEAACRVHHLRHNYGVLLMRYALSRSLVLDGNPLLDLSLFQQQGTH